MPVFADAPTFSPSPAHHSAMGSGSITWTRSPRLTLSSSFSAAVKSHRATYTFRRSIPFGVHLYILFKSMGGSGRWEGGGGVVGGGGGVMGGGGEKVDWN